MTTAKLLNVMCMLDQIHILSTFQEPHRPELTSRLVNRICIDGQARYMTFTLGEGNGQCLYFQCLELTRRAKVLLQNTISRS